MPIVPPLPAGDVILAYIGPGAGLSALGALLAVSVALIVALFGFVWYPLRRLVRILKRNRRSCAEGSRDVGQQTIDAMEPPAGSPVS